MSHPRSPVAKTFMSFQRLSRKSGADEVGRRVAGIARISLNFSSRSLLSSMESHMAVERTLSIIKPGAVAGTSSQDHYPLREEGLRIIAVG